jgi:FkbM family methyltransferase
MFKIFTKRESEIFKQLKKSKYLSNIKDIESQFMTNEHIIKYRYKDFDLFINNEASALYHIVNSVQKIENLANSIILEDCNIIFDIGANVGLFTFFSNLRYNNANYYLFEADPNLIKIIKQNCKQVSNLFINNVAISNLNSEEVTFYINNDSAQTNSTLRENVELFGNNIKSINVRATTLDDFCTKNNINVIDVLKIDIQGGELDALLSGLNIIRNIKCMQLELCFGFNDALKLAAFVEKHFNRFEIVNQVYQGFDINLYKN